LGIPGLGVPNLRFPRVRCLFGLPFAHRRIGNVALVGIIVFDLPLPEA
jgi:hypothetical protein